MNKCFSQQQNPSFSVFLQKKRRMAAVGEKKLRALVFPLPLQGHLTPTINLSLKLASKGLAVTFVNFDHIHKMLSQAQHQTTEEFDLFTEARRSGFDIRYTTISDGLQDDFDRVAGIKELYEYMLRSFQPLMDEFVGEIIRSDPDSTYFLVADTIFVWQAAAAENYNLLHVSVWTQPALVFSLAYHLELLKEKGHYPLKDDVHENVKYIPGIKSVSTNDFMTYYNESRMDNPAFELTTRGFTHVKKADFVLHNTAHELESNVLSALNNYQPHYAIGPINFYKNLINNTTSLWSESSCSEWLQSKPRGSVLYISFGSLVPTNDQVLKEIAHGVLLSQVNFIWVTRDKRNGSSPSIFPDGFEDDVKDRGLIVPWCNQNMVLADPAVGGFLTHCGWNSVVESIWHGAPMLCYPIEYDQPTNRKLVVDDWEIGLNVSDGKTVDRHDVADKIKSLMTGDTSKSLNHQTINVKNTLRSALEPKGSSEKNFDRFITDVKLKLGIKFA